MKKSFLPIVLVLCVLLLGGCQPFSTLFSNQQPLTLTIDQIQTDSQPGRYALIGQASLPDGTELIVSAVRPLISSNPEVDLSEAAIHSTLARNSAVVKNGGWQAQLQLWQASPQGSYQESWQMQDALDPLALSPQKDVVFAVVLSPGSLAQSQQKSLNDLERLGENPVFNVTPAGEPYLEARKSLTVALPNPNGVATLPIQTPAPSPWVGRSNQVQTDTSFTEEQELPFAENDNLPVQASNLLD